MHKRATGLSFNWVPSTRKGYAFEISIQPLNAILYIGGLGRDPGMILAASDLRILTTPIRGGRTIPPLYVLDFVYRLTAFNNRSIGYFPDSSSYVDSSVVSEIESWGGKLVFDSAKDQVLSGMRVRNRQYWYEVALMDLLSSGMSLDDGGIEKVWKSTTSLSDSLKAFLQAIMRDIANDSKNLTPNLQSISSMKVKYISDMIKKIDIKGMVDDKTIVVFKGKEFGVGTAAIDFLIRGIAIAAKKNAVQALYALHLKQALPYLKNASPDFRNACRTIIAEAENPAQREWDVFLQALIETAADRGFSLISRDRAKIVARKLVDRLGVSAGSVSLASAIVSQVSVFSWADIISSFLFQTSQLYEDSKIVSHSSYCMNEFNAMLANMENEVDTKGNDSAELIRTWANCVSLREMSVLSYDNAIARILNGGGVIAPLIRNLPSRKREINATYDEIQNVEGALHTWMKGVRPVAVGTVSSPPTAVAPAPRSIRLSGPPPVFLLASSEDFTIKIVLNKKATRFDLELGNDIRDLTEPVLLTDKRLPRLKWKMEHRSHVAVLVPLEGPVLLMDKWNPMISPWQTYHPVRVPGTSFGADTSLFGLPGVFGIEKKYPRFTKQALLLAAKKFYPSDYGGVVAALKGKGNVAEPVLYKMSFRLTSYLNNQLIETYLVDIYPAIGC